jgi:hypothetical protein
MLKLKTIFTSTEDGEELITINTLLDYKENDIIMLKHKNLNRLISYEVVEKLPDVITHDEVIREYRIYYTN